MCQVFKHVKHGGAFRGRQTLFIKEVFAAENQHAITLFHASGFNARQGVLMACTNDECKNTRKILRNGEVAPPKEDPVPLPELPCEKSDAYFVLRDGAAGVFLAANTFPKSRETRAPLVEELHRFRDRLPEKLRYLADAPQQDPESNKTVVRFSRKTKQQYVAAEKEGKATGWSAFFVDGKWVEGKK